MTAFPKGEGHEHERLSLISSASQSAFSHIKTHSSEQT